MKRRQPPTPDASGDMPVELQRFVAGEWWSDAPLEPWEEEPASWWEGGPSDRAGWARFHRGVVARLAWQRAVAAWQRAHGLDPWAADNPFWRTHGHTGSSCPPSCPTA